jgi:hypothetical protein
MIELKLQKLTGSLNGSIVEIVSAALLLELIRSPYISVQNFSPHVMGLHTRRTKCSFQG